MGEETVGPSGSKKTGERKHRDLRLLLLGKLCFNTRKAFTAWLRKNRLDPGTGLVNPGATAIRLPLRLLLPAPQGVGCHGQPQAPSAASAGGGGPQDRQTPR